MQWLLPLPLPLLLALAVLTGQAGFLTVQALKSAGSDCRAGGSCWLLIGCQHMQLVPSPLSSLALTHHPQLPLHTPPLPQALHMLLPDAT